MHLEAKFRNITYLVKGILLKFYLRLHGCRVGKRLKVKRWPIFRAIPCSNIQLGNFVTIGFYIAFDPSATGRIIVGDYVNLTQSILIGTASEVKIGANTLIAEFVSIRDGDHGTERDRIISSQDGSSIPIEIGEDVWIGAGSVVLKGAKIENGAIIGANSVVTRPSPIKPYYIYAGNPLREIGIRR